MGGEWGGQHVQGMERKQLIPTTNGAPPLGPVLILPLTAPLPLQSKGCNRLLRGEVTNEGSILGRRSEESEFEAENIMDVGFGYCYGVVVDDLACFQPGNHKQCILSITYSYEP